jgi:hypothetical protein
MRRDYFTLEVDGVDDEQRKPSVTLAFEGPSDMLAERLGREDGTVLDESEVDVAFRYTTPVDDDEAEGVFSVTNRLTGEFILETNTAGVSVTDLVEAARSDEAAEADGGRYVIHITDGGEEIAVYDKRTLLVYDTDGDLRRQHSLIPGGVEL